MSFFLERDLIRATQDELADQRRHDEPTLDDLIDSLETDLEAAD